MTSRRTSLANLLPPAADRQIVPPVATATPSAELPPEAPRASSEPAAVEQTDASLRSKDTSSDPQQHQPPSEGAKLPRYLQLVRKETRLREEQYDQLTDLARRLERRRPRKAGDRITENTLIRIAIDLLLDHSDELHGTTEDELRNSVTS